MIGYTELEYIESTGTQWIDTGVYANGSTKVVADVEITYGSGWTMLMGSFDSNAYFSWWTKDALICAYYASKNIRITGPTGRSTLTANGPAWKTETERMDFTQTTFTATSTMFLFSIHNGGDYANGSMKLYSCQICDNGKLVRDFVPCRSEAGEVGLYDKVEGVFYANAGTGDFKAGAEVYDPTVVKLPRIAAASFSVNPVDAETSTVISVTVVEETVYLEPEFYFSGDIFSGEV